MERRLLLGAPMALLERRLLLEPLWSRTGSSPELFRLPLERMLLPGAPLAPLGAEAPFGATPALKHGADLAPFGAETALFWICSVSFWSGGSSIGAPLAPFGAETPIGAPSSSEPL